LQLRRASSAMAKGSIMDRREGDRVRRWRYRRIALGESITNPGVAQARSAATSSRSTPIVNDVGVDDAVEVNHHTPSPSAAPIAVTA